jgi:hypothetical protein
MAKQTINLGTSELAGDGESIRSAFDKCNDNFTENYASIASIESDIATLDGSKIVYGDLSVTTASASGAGALSYNSSTGVFTFTPAAGGFDGDYDSLTNKPTIPADVSDLTDTTNLLDHFSGSYDDLTDKPTIPTVPTTVSSFTNDSGYITGYTVTESDVTAHQAALTITESQISDWGSYQPVTSVPANDFGSVGDAEGQIAIDDNYLHYCYKDFTSETTYNFTTQYHSGSAIRVHSVDWANWPSYVTAGWQVYRASIPSLKYTILEVRRFNSDVELIIGSSVSTSLNQAWVAINPGDVSIWKSLPWQAFETNFNVTNWDTAYGWGNHASAGYLTSETFASLVQDTTPQLGGNLDLNSSNITGTGDISITGTATFTDAAWSEFILHETDNDTAGRFIALSGDVYVQAGAQGSGKATSSGNLRFSGYNNDNLNSLQAKFGNTFVDVATVSTTQTFTNKSGNISQWTNDSGYVESDTTGITGADQVSNIVTLTQAEYDAIGTPNASTVYIIVG